MNLVWFIREFFATGLQAKLEVVLLALLLVVSLLALSLCFSSKAAMMNRFFAGLVVALGACALVATRNVVVDARGTLLAILLPGPARAEGMLDPSEASRRLAQAMSQSLFGPLLAGASVSFSCLVLCVLFWRSGLSKVSRLLGSAASAIVCVSGAFVVVYAERGSVPFHYCEGEEKAACSLLLLESMSGVTDVGSGLVLALGVAAFTTIAFVAFQEGRLGNGSGYGRAVAGAAALLLGGAAFSGTRGMAHDAHRLLSVPTQRYERFDWPELPNLPRATARCEPIEAPLVVVSAKGVSADGNQLDDLGELESVLRNKRQLWMMINPGRSFPGVVLVAAPGDLPPPLFGPALRAARRSGFRRVGVYSIEPRGSVLTRTLGVVPRSGRCCATLFELDSRGRPVESFSTWGALLGAVARDPELRISPG